MSAQPADKQDAGVNRKVHQGEGPGEDLFRGEEPPVDVLGGSAELVVFVILPDVSLHHPDGGDVFLDAGVQVVIPVEHLPEVDHGLGHNEEEKHTQHDHGYQIDAGQPGADEEGHHHGHQQGGGGPGAHPQDHHVGVLHVGHVGGQAGDETGGAELINVGEREGLDVFVHGLAQIPGQACGGPGAELGSQDAHNEAEHRQDQHQHAGALDVAQVPGGDPLVDDGGHEQRDDHLHDDLQQHHNGG